MQDTFGSPYSYPTVRYADKCSGDSGKVTRRQIRLLPATTPPGTGNNAEPVQCCTSKELTTHYVPVIVCVGPTTGS